MVILSAPDKFYVDHILDRARFPSVEDDVDIVFLGRELGPGVRLVRAVVEKDFGDTGCNSTGRNLSSPDSRKFN